MEYCDAGSHPTLNGFEYPPGKGYRWCPEHLPPSGDIDPAKPGICEVGRVHRSDRTFWVPVMGKRACAKHLGVLVREVIRRSEYGR